MKVQQPSLTDPSYLQLLLGRIRALTNKRTAVCTCRSTRYQSCRYRSSWDPVSTWNSSTRAQVTDVDVVEGLAKSLAKCQWRISSPRARIFHSRRKGLWSGNNLNPPTKIRPRWKDLNLAGERNKWKVGVRGGIERAEVDREARRESLQRETEMNEVQEGS